MENNNIATVQVIHADKLDVFKWIRKNIPNLGIKEAKDLSECNVLTFDDYKEALNFYEHFSSMLGTSARLFIQDSYDSTGFVAGNCVSLEDVNEIDKYKKEFEDGKD